jgi:hypothetical protein
MLLTPHAVVRGHLARGRRELLVQWVGLDPSSASWVDLEEFRRLYPSFKLEDDLVSRAGEMSWSASGTSGETGEPKERRRETVMHQFSKFPPN